MPNNDDQIIPACTITNLGNDIELGPLQSDLQTSKLKIEQIPPILTKYTSNTVLPSIANIGQDEFNFVIPQNSKSGVKPSPSWRNWIAASNTMMGTSIVVFPVIFQQNGILTSLFCMITVAFFMYKTCSYYLTYKLPHEIDTYQTIQRILGRKWKIFYNVANALLLFFVQIIYFLLLASFLYPCLKILFQNKFGVEFAGRKETSFDQFSFQWISIITSVILFLLLAKRDLAFIMKFTQFGLLTVIAIIIYVLVKFGQSSVSEFDLDKTPLFTSNIFNITGIFILSFQIHSLIVPILKDNVNQKQNKRDLVIIYTIPFVVYSIISLFGVFCISGKKPVEGYSGDTILEFYSDSDAFNIFIRLGLCIYIMGVYPIIVYCSRVNFFSILQKDSDQKQFQPSNKVYLLTNLVYSGSALLAVLINIDLTTVMLVAGYSVSFFSVILIPILIRFKGAKLLKDTQNARENINISRNQEQFNDFQEKNKLNPQSNEKGKLACFSNQDVQTLQHL